MFMFCDMKVIFVEMLDQIYFNVKILKKNKVNYFLEIYVKFLFV